MTRISIVVPSLGMGGAERVAATLANEWILREHPVQVVSYSAATGDHFELEPGVQRVALNMLEPSHGLIARARARMRRVLALRRALLGFSPDVVVAVMDVMNVHTIVALAGTQIPVVVTEHNDPAQRPVPRTVGLLREVTYRRATAVTVLNESLRGWAERFRVPVFVMPNPIELCPTQTRTGGMPVKLMTAGRLERQKGFDLLVQAAHHLPPELDWRLDIVGDGSQRSRLQAMIESYALEDRIRILPPVPRLCEVFTGADIFVLSSRYEGFGNVLVEAMSAGLACVAFDCPSGPRHIITQEVDGLLVSPLEPSALAQALTGVLRSSTMRARLGAQAAETAKHYSVPRVMDQWDVLITTILPRSPRDRAA